MIETQQPKPRAILVRVQLPDIDDIAHEASFKELGRLVETLGYDVVGTLSQRMDGTGSGTLFGKGKLAELARITGGTGVVGSLATSLKSKARLRFEAEAEEDILPPIEPDAPDIQKPDYVIVDHEISPSQARNLERATGAYVLDRTGVIVEIFHRHANSRAAKLQVEMARLKYVAPRLRESSAGSGRQQGVGTGETNLEVDRRKIRDRLAELKRMLESVQRDNDQRRSARRDELRVALVGYTNAGKSSLMRALTASDVMVADKLFATLDTTVRALQPETKPRILVSDTVGFIKQLPHDLVASFRSTLDEALEASLLLYVVDASDQTYEAQLDVSRTVLHEIGADIVLSKLILNKIDCLTADELEALYIKHPDAIFLSSKNADHVANLRLTLIAFFEHSMVDDTLVLPYSNDAQLGDIYQSVRVLSEDYDEQGRVMKIRGMPNTIARLRRGFAK
jgi:GTPase